MKKYTKMTKLRKEKGYTLESLAKKVGISKQYMWDIEEGRKVLSYKMAFLISRALDTKPDELFLKDHKRK